MLFWYLLLFKIKMVVIMLYIIYIVSVLSMLLCGIKLWDFYFGLVIYFCKLWL